MRYLISLGILLSLFNSISVKAEEPTEACLKPFLGTTDDTVRLWLQPFFGGTNAAHNNGCQRPGDAPKLVCIPRANDRDIARANAQAQDDFNRCPNPKPVFQEPFTNECKCSCEHFSDTYCWGDTLKSFDLKSDW